MLEKYLPIGTVVLLNNGTKKLMITGFCTATANDPNLIYDYSGCFYPEGVVSADQVLLFNHTDINQIFFMGYADQEHQVFIERLKSLMLSVSTGEYVYDENEVFNQPDVQFKPEEPINEEELIEYFKNS